MKWGKFLTLYIWYQRGRDGWLWQGDAGGSQCQINHFYWPLPLESVDLCSSSLLITHYKSAIHGCVWMRVFSALRDKEREKESNKKVFKHLQTMHRMQFGHIWFERTFPLNDSTNPLSTYCVGSLLVLLCSEFLCERTGSVEYHVSDCSCGPFNLMRCLPPIIIQLGAEQREMEGGAERGW